MLSGGLPRRPHLLSSAASHNHRQPLTVPASQASSPAAGQGIQAWQTLELIRLLSVLLGSTPLCWGTKISPFPFKFSLNDREKVREGCEQEQRWASWPCTVHLPGPGQLFSIHLSHCMEGLQLHPSNSRQRCCSTGQSLHPTPPVLHLVSAGHVVPVPGHLAQPVVQNLASPAGPSIPCSHRSARRAIVLPLSVALSAFICWRR